MNSINQRNKIAAPVKIKAEQTAEMAKNIKPKYLN
jgi:hypothetical protein